MSDEVPDAARHRFASVPLLAWMRDPSTSRGISELLPGGHSEKVSYADLALRIRAQAACFRAEGLAPGSVVALALPGGIDFAVAFCAVLHAGATPSPIAPPLPFQSASEYRHRFTGKLRAVRPERLVTNESLRSRMIELAAAFTGLPVSVVDAGAHSADEVDGVPPASTALIQFTSGSSGAVKAVRISRAALEEHVAVIRSWLGMRLTDRTASWLPMHHDMGLIGCFLTPVVNTGDVQFMRPDQFLRDPLSWLRCFDASGATLTAIPPFAMRHIAARVSADMIADLNFSGWRVAIVGAEPIAPEDLRAFLELMAPRGFRSSTFCPAYGLAEACLAVTGVATGSAPRFVVADLSGTRIGGAVAHSVPTHPGPGTADGVGYVGCGRPLGATSVTVVDEAGRALPEATLGEIVVASDTLADAYLFDDPHAEASRLAAGCLDGGSFRTGDAGFVLDGELFVAGRLGDSIKHNGVSVLAEELEAVLADASGTAPPPVVLLGTVGNTSTAIVLLDRRAGSSLPDVETLLTRRVPGLDVRVVPVGRRDVLRTSSGKVRRREMWEIHAADDAVRSLMS